MREPYAVRQTVGLVTLVLLSAALSEAQAPRCSDISATTPEDATLAIQLPCSESGLLAGLASDFVRTVAGNGTPGWSGDGGPASGATFNQPEGVLVDAAGNLYIADTLNAVIRRVDAASGVVTTIAGLGVPSFGGDGGPATAAFLNYPRRLALDAAGHLFFSDFGNRRIRRIDAATGIISTVAGGGTETSDGIAATSVTAFNLTGLAFDAAGDLFLVDENRVRRVVRGADGLLTGAPDEIITTVAGTGSPGFSGDGGPAANAQFWSAEDLVFDPDGNLYVADTLNRRVRRVAAGADGIITGADDEIVTTFAGGGNQTEDGIPATSADLFLTVGIAADASGGIFISSLFGNRLHRVDALTGIITTVVGGGDAMGEDIPAATARLDNSRGLDIDADGNLYIAELGAHRIRAVRLVPSVLIYEFVQPALHGLVTVQTDGTLLYVPHPNFFGNDSMTFRVLNSAGESSEIGTLNVTVTPVEDLPIANAGPDQTVDGATPVFLDGSASSDPDRTATGLRFAWSFISQPLGSRASLENTDTAHPTFTPDISGVYIVQLTVRDARGQVATDEVAVTASIPIPLPSPECDDVAATTPEDTSLALLLPCRDTGRLDGLDVGEIRTIAGNGTAGWTGDGGTAILASLNYPFGIALDRAGNLYVADVEAHVVRRIDATTGTITTIAGRGVAGADGNDGPATLASLNGPRGVAVDRVGNVFIADATNACIRRVDAATGIITRVAGLGRFGGTPDEGVAATLAYLAGPVAIAFDAAGDLFFVETGGFRVRRIARGVDGLLTGASDEIVTTVAGNGTMGVAGDGGPALSAQFSVPVDLAFDAQGNLYVADSFGNYSVRRVVAGGNGVIDGAADEIITTVAGGGTAAGDGVLATAVRLNEPRGVTVDRFGNLFISEAPAQKVRRVDAATGIITTIVGDGSATGEDIPASTAQTFVPTGLVADRDGNLFIAELGTHRVRAVRLAPQALTYEVVSAPLHGLALVRTDGTLAYTPQSNFFGDDSMTFRALNSAGQSSEIATLTVTVTSVDDPPVANAGPDQTIDGAVVVRLNGSSSLDPDGTPITFSWSIRSRPSGSRSLLQNSNTAFPTFTPDLSGIYMVELAVTDSIGQRATDTVRITATVPVLHGVTLNLRYGGSPPSDAGAAYWIEADLMPKCYPSCTTSTEPVTLGVITSTDSVTRWGTPLGDYRVRLRYGPGGKTAFEQDVEFSPSSLVSVQAGQVSSVTAHLDRAMGRIEGQVWINGQRWDRTFRDERREFPEADELMLCVAGTVASNTTTAKGGNKYKWCQPLAPTPEGFIDLLLPGGSGRGSVCRPQVVTAFGQCEPLDAQGQLLAGVPTPLASFPYQVRVGRTEPVQIDIVASRVTMTLQYDRDPPTATGADYWIEADLVPACLPRCSTPAEVVPLGVSHGTDIITRWGVPAGDYRVRLRYGPGGTTPFEQDVEFFPNVVRVLAGQMTAVAAELESAMFVLDGQVRVNGELWTQYARWKGIEFPEPNELMICIVGLGGPITAKGDTGERYRWCKDLAPDENGVISLLLPEGPGRGSVCRPAVVARFGQCEPVDSRGQLLAGVPTPLASFLFDAGGAAQDVVIDIVAARVTVALEYKGQPPSGTFSGSGKEPADYWIEADLVPTCGSKCTGSTEAVTLGRISDTTTDSLTRWGVPVGDYRVRLRYGPGGTTPFEQNVEFSQDGVFVKTAQATAVTAELRAAMGTLEGHVVINGQSWPDPTRGERIEVPGADALMLCVVGTGGAITQRGDTGERYRWCKDLPPIDQGAINLLLPAGTGRGTVCRPEVVTEFGQCEPVDSQGQLVPGAPPPLGRFAFEVRSDSTTEIQWQ